MNSDGMPMQTEVPFDKYNSAVQAMCRNGKYLEEEYQGYRAIEIWSPSVLLESEE